MLSEAMAWYDDTDRPLFRRYFLLSLLYVLQHHDCAVDPYTASWSDMGMEPRDPFDPNVEDSTSTDGGEEGGGDGEAVESEDDHEEHEYER